MHFVRQRGVHARGLRPGRAPPALAPVSALDAMRLARPGITHDVDLTSGPAELCQAMGIDAAEDGADLVTGDDGLRVEDGGSPRS